MATRTEHFDTIASIIKREIQRRKKQKKPLDDLPTSIQIANAPEDDEELTLLKSPLKMSKKKKKKSKMAIKEDTESSKYESLQKNLKNMEDVKKNSSEEQLNEIHNDPAMVTIPYNSRIPKVRDEEYPDLSQKLFKNKKKDKTKTIKVGTNKEHMSQKQSKKGKRQTTDKEYLKNDSLQSVGMDVETFYDSDNFIDDDGEKELEFFDYLDDHTSKYRTMTDIGEKPYACDVCGISFSRQDNLVRHTRTHTGEKPYACNVCSRYFSHKSTLVIHTRTHTGDKPYACNVCGRYFSHKSTLVIHKRTHTGEKPYVCDVCGQSFFDARNLSRHKITHTGEKPYACNVCGRSFSQQSNLVTHKRTHSGEKPYTCNVCGLSFSQRGNFLVHYRLHTGEKPFECGQCEEKFSLNKYLLKHIRRTHTNCF